MGLLALLMSIRCVRWPEGAREVLTKLPVDLIVFLANFLETILRGFQFLNTIASLALLEALQGFFFFGHLDGTRKASLAIVICVNIN